MNKTQLIDVVAKEANLKKKDAEAAVKAVLDAIAGALVDGDKVQLVGFGTFEVKSRAAREGRNPFNGIPCFSMLAATITPIPMIAREGRTNLISGFRSFSFIIITMSIGTYIGYIVIIGSSEESKPYLLITPKSKSPSPISMK